MIFTWKLCPSALPFLLCIGNYLWSCSAKDCCWETVFPVPNYIFSTFPYNFHYLLAAMNLRQERDSCAADQRLSLPNAKHEVYGFNPGCQLCVEKGMSEESPSSEFGRGQQHPLGNETSFCGESTKTLQQLGPYKRKEDLCSGLLALRRGTAVASWEGLRVPRLMVLWVHPASETERVQFWAQDSMDTKVEFSNNLYWS